MADDRVARKLAAILYADVAGYSRLTGADEEGTHRIVADYLDAISGSVAEQGGRVVHYAGDAVLADFPSVVKAVECAVDIQTELRARNADIPDDRKVQFRIGVNLGDVIVDRDDIYGEGVNIAARLESLAEPGGICVSRTVYNHIKGKVDLCFEDLGKRKVKNISEPVHIFRVRPDNVGVKNTNHRLSGKALSLPDKPSIAVLPFENLSVDPEQNFFADGMTEDIITGLSRFRTLFVIARNSTFAFKGKSPDVREVAQDLGVRYVLEGSVRRGGNRIRIAVQLIDAETGNHLWAERYDRELEDMFAVQDEVTEAIVAAVAPEIGLVERSRAQRKPPGSLQAWDVHQQGVATFHSSTTEDDYKSAIYQFDKVNEIDPSFAPAFAMATAARTRYVGHFAPKNRAALLNEAREKANRAITLDPRDPLCLWNYGRVQSLFGHHDIAISKSEEAVSLNPSDAMSHHYLGVVLCTAGKADKAIAHFDQAMRLSPRDTYLPGMQTYKAFALFDLERYDEAFTLVQRARLGPHPRPLTFALLIAVAAKLGKPKEVQAAVHDLMSQFPGISCSRYKEPSFGRPAAMKRLVGALREAGLPE